MEYKFSLMPDDWRLSEVASFARVKGGKRLPAGEEFADGVTPYPYLRVTNMVSGTIDDEGVVYVKPEIQKFISNYTISSNDLYVTIAGTLGMFGGIPEKYEGAQLTENAAKLTNIDPCSFDLDYLNYSLNGEFIQSQVSREIGIGAGVPKLALYRIEKLKVPLPASLKEQQKIAKILTTVDNLIKKTEALIEKYQAIKQGMMHDLFTRGIDTNGQLRPSHHDAPYLYKQTELGWIPKVWDVVSLDSLSTRITNGFVGVATPFYTNTEDGVMYLYGNNVRKDKLELDNVLRVTENFHEKQRKSQLYPGDMVTVQSGHIGTTAVIPNGLGDINCHALIITKFKADAVSPNYVSFFCNSEIGMLSMERIFIGSTILHINTSEFKYFSIPLPNRNEQDSISLRIDGINRRIEKEGLYLSKLIKTKKGIMQDLLTGKVRVSN